MIDYPKPHRLTNLTRKKPDSLHHPMWFQFSVEKKKIESFLESVFGWQFKTRDAKSSRHN